jgi:ABC-type dipeptide/oligopeptide/nickel transport systems, permease components
LSIAKVPDPSLAAAPSVVAESVTRPRAGRLWSLAALFPVAVFAFLLLMALAAPMVAPHDPLELHLNDRLLQPSVSHLLGTDELGRDILSRLIFGARVSLTVGFGSTMLALLVGVALGSWAGYVQGFSSSVIMRTSDVLLAFPPILLAMLTTTVLGPSILNLSLAIAIVQVPGFVRLARAVMLAEKNLQYVEAARALGGSHAYIMFRSVLPNTVTPLAVQTALGVAGAVLLEAGLSFLGLGVTPPTPSWGLMLQEARPYLRVDAWYGVFPGLALLILVLTMNGLADLVGRTYGRKR